MRPEASKTWADPATVPWPSLPELWSTEDWGLSSDLEKGRSEQTHALGPVPARRCECPPGLAECLLPWVWVLTLHTPSAPAAAETRRVLNPVVSCSEGDRKRRCGWAHGRGQCPDPPLESSPPRPVRWQRKADGPRAGPLMESLRHVPLQDPGAPGEVRLLLRFRTQSTSSRESRVTSSGRNPQQSPCQEQGAGAGRKGWRCRQSGRSGGTSTGGATRGPGLQLQPYVHGSGHVPRVMGSVLPHLPPGGPSPAGLGAHCEPTDGIRCHGPEHTTGTHGLWPFPILSHQGPRLPLSLSPRHGQQVGSCSPRDVLPQRAPPNSQYP